jgi:ATP-binding cassette subfamily B protein
MSATPTQQSREEKKPQGTFASIARLYPYVKPALPRIFLGMVAALAAAVVALIIPQVLEALVDGPLQTGDSAQIWPAFAIVLGLGVIEAVMIMLRRWFVLVPGTHIEARMRNGLYKQLQELPVSFHDRWPSGQLLSRAVSDLNLIRRWLSFGFVLLIVNVLTILIGFVFLVSISWVLGVLFMVCSIPLWIYGYVFENK